MGDNSKSSNTVRAADWEWCFWIWGVKVCISDRWQNRRSLHTTLHTTNLPLQVKMKIWRGSWLHTEVLRTCWHLSPTRTYLLCSFEYTLCFLNLNVIYAFLLLLVLQYSNSSSLSFNFSLCFSFALWICNFWLVLQLKCILRDGTDVCSSLKTL